MSSKLSKLQKGLTGAINSMLSSNEKSANEDYDVSVYKPKANKNHQVEVEIRILPTISADGNIRIFQEEWKHYMHIGGVSETFPCLTAKESGLCPICNANKTIFSDDNYEKMKAEGRFRSKKWVANILVIDDPEEPENNGKIFYYFFGVKLYDKITAELKDDPTLLDPENGYNLKLKIDNADNFDIKKKVYPNYDKSSFVRKPSAIAEDEDAIIEILDNCLPLEKFAKIYETDPAIIEKKFNDFMLKATGEKATTDTPDIDDDEVPFGPSKESIAEKRAKEKKDKAKKEVEEFDEEINEDAPEETNNSEEDVDLDEFLKTLTE